MPVLTTTVLLAGLLSQAPSAQLPAPFAQVTSTEQKTATLWTGDVKIAVGPDGDAIFADEASYIPDDGVMELRGAVRFRVSTAPRIGAVDAKHAPGGTVYRGDVRIRFATGAVLRADQAYDISSQGEVWLAGNVRVEKLTSAPVK